MHLEAVVTFGFRAGDATAVAEAEPAADSVERHVLESNPLLESWGNARTLRNDNSSRFGKWIELKFDESARLGGATIKTYLLEKVRLGHQAEGERTFHAVYELCRGASADEKRRWGLPDDPTSRYALLASSAQNTRADGVDDEAQHSRVRAAAAHLRIDDLDDLHASLAGVLRLGDVRFVDREHETRDASAEVENADAISPRGQSEERVAADARGCHVDNSDFERPVLVSGTRRGGGVARPRREATRARAHHEAHRGGRGGRLGRRL